MPAQCEHGAGRALGNQAQSETQLIGLAKLDDRIAGVRQHSAVVLLVIQHPLL
jgi:hypothetical protein